MLVERLDVLRNDELEELLGESYRMVVEKLPRPKRAARKKRCKTVDS